MLAPDRIGDPADQAQQLEELERSEGVRVAKAALTGAGTSHCLRCGDEISAARRAALPSTTLCLDCREQAEFSRRIAGEPHRAPVQTIRAKSGSKSGGCL